MEGGSVALRCDHMESNPPPVIQWYASQVTNTNYTSNPWPVAPEPDVILYGDGGRYLFVSELTSVQRWQQFYCEVTNPVLNMATRSSITYVLNRDIPFGQTMEYKQLETKYALVNEEVTVLYSAAAVDNNGRQRPIMVSCFVPSGSEFRITVEDDLILNVVDITTPTSDAGVTLTCDALSSIGVQRVQFTLVVGGRLQLNYCIIAAACTAHVKHFKVSIHYCNEP